MNTRKLRKMILTLCSALLLVSMSVGLTVAYLTDTEAVTNTFTVGQVGICLDETDTDNSKTTPITDCGCSAEDDHDHTGRDLANSYKLMPGHEYVKDPTIFVHNDSEEAYLRIKVQVSNTAKVDALFQEKGYAETGITSILSGFKSEDWNVTSNTVDVETDVRTYVMQYKTTIDGTTTDIKLFDKVVIPAAFDNDDIIELNNTNLTITAEAIQAAGFTDTKDENGTVTKSAETAAWEAFDAQKTAANN